MTRTTIALSFCLLFASTNAHAYTKSGYIIDFEIRNSSDSLACVFTLGSSSSASFGTSYYVDDVSNEYDATCSVALLAMYFDKYLTVNYTVSGGTNYAEGLYSTEPSDVPYLYTHDSTGTSSADKCMAVFNGSSGAITRYVDDNYAEETVTCTSIAMMHFWGTTNWTVSYSASGEITSLKLKD